jgi:hypothetical protein
MGANTIKGIAFIAVITGLACFSGGILSQDKEHTVQYYIDSLFSAEIAGSDDDVEWPRPDSTAISIDTIGYWYDQLVIEVVFLAIRTDWCDEAKAILLESGQRKVELLYFSLNECTEVILKPAEIAEVDSISILFTRSPITGTGGIVEERYWVWNEIENKPVDLKTDDVTCDALAQVLPARHYLAYGGFFDINSLSLEGPVRRPGDYNCCPTGGWIALKYGIDNFSLQVISHTYDPKKRPNDK